jgi:FemAB family protein
MNIDDWNQLSNIPVSHTRAMIDYQNAYFNRNDSSRVLYENNEPVGIWPGIIGQQVHAPLFSGASEKVQKKICNEILSGEFTTNEGLIYGEYSPSFNLSTWGKILLDSGYKPWTKFRMYVNLQLSEAEIWTGIRKSYQSLINQFGKLKEYTITVNPAVTKETFNRYKEFHIATSGRQTRSDKTWELQYQAVKSKDAFCIQIKRDRTELVGYSYFNTSPIEALYSVGVYNRELTESESVPLGHVSIWKAIKYAKKLGIVTFDLGEYNLSSDKDKSISRFKSGFATSIVPYIEFTR